MTAKNARALKIAAALCGVVVDRVLDPVLTPYGKPRRHGITGITHRQHQQMVDEGYAESPLGTIPFWHGASYVCIHCASGR